MEEKHRKIAREKKEIVFVLYVIRTPLSSLKNANLYREKSRKNRERER